MRKFLVSLLAVCMIFSMLSITSFASSSPVDVDGVGYDSLSAAVSALKKDGTLQTITLNDNVTATAKIAFPSGTNVVFDLNGKTLSVSGMGSNAIELNGNITIKNGTVYDNRGSSGAYTLDVFKGGNCVLKDNLFINSTADSGAITVDKQNSTTPSSLTVYDSVKINTAYNVIFGYADSIVTIYGGEFVSSAKDARVMKFTGDKGLKVFYGGKIINNNATSSTSLSSFISGYKNAKYYGGTYSSTSSKVNVASNSLTTKDNGDNTYSIVPKDNVPIFVNEKLGIENVLDVVLAASDEGDTIKLKSDATSSDLLTISKSIVLDLDGHTFTSTYTTTTGNAPSTVCVKNNANVTILNGKIINSSDSTTPNFGIGVGMSGQTDTSSLTLGGDGKPFEFSSLCKTNAISIYSPESTLTVNDGATILAANENAANAIYTYGKLIINGGNLLNNNPVKNSMKAVYGSVVEINGGHFPNYVVCQTSDMIINDGVFDAPDIAESTATPKIYGGTFKNIPKGIVSGKYAVKNAEGTYNIKTEYAAKIATAYYAALALAVDEADSGAAIDLNVNGESATVSKALTINKNGFTANITAGEGYEVSETGTAYVVSEKADEDPLVTLLSNIKAKDYTSDNGTMVIRYVAPIDSLDYKMVGFILVDAANEATIDTAFDWQSKSKIVYTDITVGSDTFAPSDFAENANYVFTTAIGNIPAGETPAISLKAFAIKADGSIVFGKLVRPVR